MRYRWVFALNLWLCLSTQPLSVLGFVTLSTSLPSTTAEFSQSLLLAKPKKKKTTTTSGGGFGAVSNNSKPKAVTISADKNSLEQQWDTFVAITDLEIRPKTEEENFEVVDVFVRSGNTEQTKGTPWFRVGKVCADAPTTIEAALTLQKGLIFWTAVHMRRELVAAGGKSGAAALELGYTASSMNVGSESDGPIDEEEEGLEITIAERVPVKDTAPKTFGFRPDWNPPGFTYKRREKAVMKSKKKTSTLEEIASIEE